MGKVDYFIGIEGMSTTRSVAVLANAKGEILSAASLPEGLNLHTIESGTLANRLNRLARKLFKSVGLRTIDAISRSQVCIGMSGVTYAYERRVELPKLLESELGWTFNADEGRLACTGDAEICFASHAQCDCGSLLIAHTGSVAYAVRAKNGLLHHFRFGGWGPNLGDEGSGFWIGREALRSVLLEQAQHKLGSRLWWHIQDWLSQPKPPSLPWHNASERWRMLVEKFEEYRAICEGMDPRTLVYRFVHSLALEAHDDEYRYAIAAIVIPLMAAFRESDESAITIVKNAASHLAEQHYRACEIARQRVDGGEQLGPIVLYGGVFRHNPEFQNEVVKRIRDWWGGEPSIVTANTSHSMRPALGALLFALGGSVTDGLRLAPKEVIDRVRFQCGVSQWMETLHND